MDFKSLINKLDSMEAPPVTPRAPKLPSAIKLDEDAQLRVLAGTSSILEEAKKMKKDEEKIKEISKTAKKEKVTEGDYYYDHDDERSGSTSVMMKSNTPVYDKLVKAVTKENPDVKTATDLINYYGDKIKNVIEKLYAEGRANNAVKPTKAAMMLDNALKRQASGNVDEGGLDMNLVKAAQGGMDKNPKDSESDKNVKKKYGYRMDGEPAERDDDPTKQERRGRKRQNTGESVEIDKEKFKEKFFSLVETKKKEAQKTIKGKKAEEKMDEGKKSSKKKPDADNDGVPDWADKKPGKDDNADKKKENNGLSAKQKKLPAGLQKAIAAKKGKKTVKESVEHKLSFREMMKLVVESGGQQQIDALDKALFTWATRVAQSKLGEGYRSDVYAGLVYERMGGRFEMYDVLSEDQK